MESLREHRTLWCVEDALKDEIVKPQVSFWKALFTIDTVRCISPRMVLVAILTTILAALGYLLATKMWIAYIPNWLAWAALGLALIDCMVSLYQESMRDANVLDLIVYFFSIAVLTQTPFIPVLLIAPAVLFIIFALCHGTHYNFALHRGRMTRDIWDKIKRSTLWYKLADIADHEIYLKVGIPISNLYKVTTKDTVDEWFEQERRRLGELSDNLRRVSEYFISHATKMRDHEEAHTEQSRAADKLVSEVEFAYRGFWNILNQLDVDQSYRIAEKELAEQVKKLVASIMPPAQTADDKPQ